MPPSQAAAMHSLAAPVSSWAPKETQEPKERTLTFRPERPRRRWGSESAGAMRGTLPTQRRARLQEGGEEVGARRAGPERAGGDDELVDADLGVGPELLGERRRVAGDGGPGRHPLDQLAAAVGVVGGEDEHLGGAADGGGVPALGL